MNELTPKERELLRLVINHYRKNGTDVDINRTLMRDQLSIEDPRLSKLRKSLAIKGYLSNERNSFALTDTIIEFMNRPVKSTGLETPIYLPLFGQVKAGRTSTEELRVELSDTTNRDDNTISIPHLSNYENVYLLEVIGDSMEHEGIFSGDYAIVQSFSKGHFPKQRELIVAKYLPAKNDAYVDDWSNIDEYLLEGPTIKYYTNVAGAEREHRLSWKTNIRKSDYTIESKYIVPVGRVMGVYRALIKDRKNR